MTKKRQILFSVIRGLLAILIALLVATLLIFLSADGDSFAEKLAATGGALKQLLVGPLFRMGRSGTKFDFKRLTDIIEKLTAAMINEDVDAVKDYSKSLRTVYNAIYDSVY